MRVNEELLGFGLLVGKNSNLKKTHQLATVELEDLVHDSLIHQNV